MKDYEKLIIKKVQLQHAFNSFGKWCSFPQEFEAREKITQDTNYSTTHTEERSIRNEKKNIANFYVTRNIILQSASCFQHFLLSNINPVSQSTQLTLSRNCFTTMGGYYFWGSIPIFILHFFYFSTRYFTPLNCMEFEDLPLKKHWIKIRMLFQ